MALLTIFSILLVLAIGGHLLARDLALVPRLLVATGVLLAAPTLLAQGLIGVELMLAAWGPLGGPATVGVRLLPAVLVAGLLVPLDVVQWTELGKPVVVMVLVALAIFAVVTAPLLATGLGA